ncbi:hypothetical protein QUF80_14900 [Desulfococcaceae bacterium HSG8]|nr:hypothetical protein [Desulfococcaceae bacterium HSG8]
MENNESSENRQWIELGTVITILVPMFYTAGWSYAYNHFDRFHLGLLGLDILREYVFLYSFWAVRDNLLIFCAVLAAAGGIYFVVKYFLLTRMRVNTGSGRIAVMFRALCVVLVPGAVLGMFWLFYAFGEMAAGKNYRNQVKNDFRAYPRVKVWVKQEKDDKNTFPYCLNPGKEKKEDDPVTEAMTREWGKGCYRLLLRNKDNLYLFYPGMAGDKTPTDIIPVGTIEAVRVLPEYHSCREPGM